MSLFRLSRPTIGLAVAVALALPAAHGQQADKLPSRTAEATPPVARQVYVIRGGQAKELANVLSLYFKAEPAFRVVPHPGSNSLLLSGPKAVMADALAALRMIDRPAQTVHVELLLIEMTGKTGGDGKGLRQVEWAGPRRDVIAKVRDLEKRGLIASTQRIQLNALNGQTAQAQARESRPYTTDVAFGGGFNFRGAQGVGPGVQGGGPGVQGGDRGAQGGGRGVQGGDRGAQGGGRGAQSGGRGAQGGGRGAQGGGAMTSRSISYRNIGTIVQVKPEIGADGQVTLGLRVEDSRMRAAEGVALATDEKGTNVSATRFVISTLESQLKVRPGYFVLAQRMATTSKVGRAQTVVLVCAVPA